MALRMPGSNVATGQVQSLGQQSVGGPLMAANAEAAAAQNIGNAIQGVSELTASIVLAEQDTRLNDQVSTSILEVDGFSRHLKSQNSYQANDPMLEGAIFDKTDASGNSRKSVGAGEVSLQIYEKKIENILGKAKKRLSATEYKIYEDKFRAEEAKYRGAVLSDSVLKKSNEMRAKTMSNATALVDAGKVEEGINLVSQSVVLTPKEQAEAVDKLKTRNEENNLVSDLYSGSLARLERSKANLTDENYNGTYTRAKREAAINDIDAQIKQLKAETVEKAEFERQKRASDLEVKVKTSKAGRAEIEESFQNRDITGQKRTQLILALNQGDAKQLKESGYNTLVSSALSGKILLSRNNKEHVAAVNHFVKNADGPTTMNVIEKTQILPDKVKSNLGAYAINGTPEQGAEALDLYQNIGDVSPYSLKSLDAQTNTMLSGASVLNEAGIPAVDAINKMREYAEIPDNKRKAYVVDRKENISALTSMMDADEDLFDLGGGYNRDVEPSLGMVADFNASVSQIFPLVQDMGLAQKIAYQGMQRVYGVTETGGEKRVMRYAPERVYGKSPEYMGSVMEDFERINNYETGSVLILSDSQTAKDLTYQVLVLNESGLPELQAKRFVPEEIFPVTNDRIHLEAMTKSKREFAINEEIKTFDDVTMKPHEKRALAEKNVDKRKAEQKAKEDNPNRGTINRAPQF